MKNLTPSTIIVKRENETCLRLPPEVLGPYVEYKPAIARGTLNGIEIYAPSTKRVRFDNIELKREDAPFIVSKEVFDALPDSAIEFITPDPKSFKKISMSEWAYHRFISKTDVEVIPFTDN